MRNDENSFTKRKRQKAKRDEAMHREQKNEQNYEAKRETVVVV